MTVESINPVSMFNDIANVRDVTDVKDVEQALNKMYFEVMLKSAFELTPSATGLSTGIGMYTDMYIQNMISEFSESHNLGFGQLQLVNDINGETK